MSKRYVGKRCVYCCEAESTTADHVFARELFLPSDRANLPKVPACGACNNRKSELESYLTVLLPFGGQHDQAETNLREMVPKRLDHNAKLKRIVRERGRVWAIEHAINTPFSTLPVDPAKVIHLFEFIVRGLAFHHFHVCLDRNAQVEVMPLTDAGKVLVDGFLNGETAARTGPQDLGHGTVRYEGAQGTDSPLVTAWRIEMYGGLQFGDSHTGAISTVMGAWSTLSRDESAQS